MTKKDVQKQSITAHLASFYKALTFNDLPSEVINKAIVLIADTIANAMYGSRSEEALPVLEVMREAGGLNESMIWGHNVRVPAHAASFVNGTFAHCNEMDDTHRGTTVHAGAFVIPSAIAIGEKMRSSGEDFLVAVIAGYETAIRIALSVSPEHRFRGYHPTATVGVFGAAIAASMLLNLDINQTVNAMGLAGSHSAGLFQFLYDGSMVKRIHPGRSAQSGVLSALFASRGLTGPPQILEGTYGFGKVMSDRFSVKTITEGLGSHWHIMDVGIKPYSACRFCHCPIDGALEIRTQPGFNPADVRSVEVLGSQQLYSQTGNQTPETMTGAQLSTPFEVALALYSGNVMPEDVKKGLSDSKILSLAQKVSVVVDPALPQTSREITIKVTMNSGEVKSAHVSLPTGEPEKPLSSSRLYEKFLMLSTPALGDTGAGVLYEILSHITRIDDISQLTPMMVADL